MTYVDVKLYNLDFSLLTPVAQRAVIDDASKAITNTSVSFKDPNEDVVFRDSYGQPVLTVTIYALMQDLAKYNQIYHMCRHAQYGDQF